MRVIFLTDGYAIDMGWFSAINRTLKAYAKNNISISTIGLGNVDRSLMQKIAKKTGGVFIDIADVAKLGEAMESGAEQYYVDDLLTTRYSVRLQFLYGLLRVLFLTILGVCMGLASVVAYGQMESAPIIAISSLALSFVGALIMELFTSCFGISDQLSWALLWLLISATICMHRVAYKSGMPRPLSGRTSQALR